MHIFLLLAYCILHIFYSNVKVRSRYNLNENSPGLFHGPCEVVRLRRYMSQQFRHFSLTIPNSFKEKERIFLFFTIFDKKILVVHILYKLLIKHKNHSAIIFRSSQVHFSEKKLFELSIQRCELLKNYGSIVRQQ